MLKDKDIDIRDLAVLSFMHRYYHLNIENTKLKYWKFLVYSKYLNFFLGAFLAEAFKKLWFKTYAIVLWLLIYCDLFVFMIMTNEKEETKHNLPYENEVVEMDEDAPISTRSRQTTRAKNRKMDKGKR